MQPNNSIHFGKYNSRFQKAVFRGESLISERILSHYLLKNCNFNWGRVEVTLCILHFYQCKDKDAQKKR